MAAAAKRSVLIVCWAQTGEGLTLAMRYVRQLPPRASCSQGGLGGDRI